MSVLAFESMPFNSKRVDIAVGTDPAAFRADLGASVDAWRADGTTAVWISCPALAAPGTAWLPCSVNASDVQASCAAACHEKWPPFYNPVCRSM